MGEAVRVLKQGVCGESPYLLLSFSLTSALSIISKYKGRRLNMQRVFARSLKRQKMKK